MNEFNQLNSFKNLRFKSVIPQDILQAVSLLEKLGCEVVGDFSADDAAKHNGFCAWDDGEITEGWLAVDGFAQVTLEDLKKMVSDDKEVLWLNRETLKEKCLNSWVYLKGFEWVKVPDGATFATGDRDKFVFRKDGWYYENGEWIKTVLTFDKVDSYPDLKLFWVKSLVKDSVFKLERLLGCEVKISYSGVTGYVTDIIDNGCFLHICYGSSFDVSSKYYLTFFTEDGDELTFTEYVKMYYPHG